LEPLYKWRATEYYCCSWYWSSVRALACLVSHTTLLTVLLLDAAIPSLSTAKVK
jgi:hypothetical protein